MAVRGGLERGRVEAGLNGIGGDEGEGKVDVLRALPVVLVHRPEAMVLGLGGCGESERDEEKANATHGTNGWFAVLPFVVKRRLVGRKARFDAIFRGSA